MFTLRQVKPSPRVVYCVNTTIPPARRRDPILLLSLLNGARSNPGQDPPTAIPVAKTMLSAWNGFCFVVCLASPITSSATWRPGSIVLSAVRTRSSIASVNRLDLGLGDRLRLTRPEILRFPMSAQSLSHRSSSRLGTKCVRPAKAGMNSGSKSHRGKSPGPVA
jgi:hypothetical protein